MERSFHNENERFDDQKAERIASLTDKRILDWFFHRMLFQAGSTPNVKVANDVSAYFPDGSVLVEYVSGDRSTGVTFKINAGVGLKKFSSGQPDADNPAFLPICVDSDDSFVTNGSDPTNPRKDRVFLKPKYEYENSQSVDIIDPVTKNITSQSKYTNLAYRYEFQYVAGTPAASPDPPDPPSGYTTNDAICEILIQPGSGAFNPDDLSDLRKLLEMDDQLVPAVTSLPAGSITVSPTVMGENNAQDALEALETQLGAQLAKGLLIGRLEYVNTQSVKLARALEGEIRVEIDGVILTSSSDITFDITTDLQSGQTESASTAYYLYVYDSSGTILHKISETAPVTNPAQKWGYHPTNTGWRCIGSFWNNESSNIVPTRWSGGLVLFYDRSTDHVHSLGTTVPTAWTSRSLNIPLCASEVRFLGQARLTSASIVYGTSDAPGTLPTGSPGAGATHLLSDSGMEGVLAQLVNDSTYPDAEASQFEIPISDCSSPAIRWGILQDYASGYSVDSNELRVIGYRDLFAPKS